MSAIILQNGNRAITLNGHRPEHHGIFSPQYVSEDNQLRFFRK
jgi:hypothetical protein